MASQNISSYIDHTLLKPETSSAQIEKLCAEAVENQFFAVCVNSRFVQLCHRLLEKTPVKIACVVGFPLGACTTSTKVLEAREAVLHGADEIDMVISLGAVKENDWTFVEHDIAAVVVAVPTAKVKVIIETALLSEGEKIKSCEAAVRAGAHFVKTSTGFNGGGATVDDILLMKKTVGDHAAVKASGGIRDLPAAQKMIEAGATRLGTSSGVALVRGQEIKGGY